MTWARDSYPFLMLSCLVSFATPFQQSFPPKMTAASSLMTRPRSVVILAVTLQSIKRHSGSRGKDAADELTRKRSDLNAIGPEAIVFLSYQWSKTTTQKSTKTSHGPPLRFLDRLGKHSRRLTSV